MIKIHFALLLLLFSVFYTGANAQQTPVSNVPGNYESTAGDLFVKEKYGASRNLFSRLQPESDLMIAFDAEKDYYISASASELQHGDAAVLLKEYLAKYPENTRTNHTWFRLANLYFRNNSFSSAGDCLVI